MSGEIPQWPPYPSDSEVRRYRTSAIRQMREERSILILTASAGAGHNIAARAVQAALHAQAPDETCEVHDVLQSTGPLFRRVYGGGYKSMVRYLPTGMGWLYRAMDQPNGRVRHRLCTMIQVVCTTGTAGYIIRRRPKLVINTHYLPAELVARLRRTGRLDCPQVTVTTDFETHRIWVHEPTERYYTATQRGQAHLIACGVPAERIVVSGIPVRSAFSQPLDRRSARRRLGLNPDSPVVLLLGGDIGFGSTHGLLVELIHMTADAQLVAVAGRNEALRRRFEALARGSRRPVTVIGFTDELHVCMRAADLVVSKPGGLTVSEALVCGLPLVIVNPIPGQETCNSDYLLAHGAAIKIDNPRQLGRSVSQLLTSPARLETLRAATLAIARPEAAADIVRDALQLLTGRAGLTNADAAEQSSGGQRQ